jgi:hypothetical protein
VFTSSAWLAAELHARSAHALRRSAPRFPRLRGDRGEGVISAAIAVLIMAFIGAAMWLGFNTIFDRTQAKVCQQIDQIGAGQPAGGGNVPACPT